VLRLILQAVQLKVEKILYKQKNRDERNAMQESIAMVETTMRVYTLKGLARQIQQAVPAYFGFDSINVMQHDIENPTQLYTITFGDEEERKHAVEAAVKKATTEREKQDLRDREAITDYVVAEDAMIQYPTSTGIVSRVYGQNQTVYYNQFTKLMDFDFVSEIDNPRGIKNIENIFMCPMTRDDGSCNGVLQLFNKASSISDFDAQRLESLGRLFGGRLEGIEDRMRQVMQNFCIVLYDTVPNNKAQHATNFMLREGPGRIYDALTTGFADIGRLDLEQKEIKEVKKEVNENQ
jgi:hypothetical protein